MKSHNDEMEFSSSSFNVENNVTIPNANSSFLTYFNLFIIAIAWS